MATALILEQLARQMVVVPLPEPILILPGCALAGSINSAMMWPSPRMHLHDEW